MARLRARSKAELKSLYLKLSSPPARSGPGYGYDLADDSVRPRSACHDLRVADLG